MMRTEPKDELYERGKLIANDPTLQGMLIGDPPRTVTNVEMLAACVYRRDQVERAAAAGTCECDEGPYIGGQCRHVAAIRCPVWKQAVGIQKRMEKEDQ
jgi:hypothetical protein